MDDFYFLNKDMRVSASPIYYVNRAGVNNEAGTDFDIKRNSSYPYCVIHFVTGGIGSVTYNNKTYPIGKGQIFIFNAYQAHGYKTDFRDRLGLNWLEFSGGDCVKLVDAVLNRQPPVIGAPGSIKANKYMLKIFSLLKKDPLKNAELISKAIYSLLLSLLFLSKYEITRGIPDYGTANIRKVAEYIDKNLNEKLSLEHLSAVSNFSTAYFAKLFHRVMGITPSQYVLGRRISRAKDILSNTDMQIDLITEQLGFCNTSHLIRQFKKAEGMTPAEYRRQCLHFRQI